MINLHMIYIVVAFSSRLPVWEILRIHLSFEIFFATLETTQDDVNVTYNGFLYAPFMRLVDTICQSNLSFRFYFDNCGINGKSCPLKKKIHCVSFLGIACLCVIIRSPTTVTIMMMLWLNRNNNPLSWLSLTVSSVLK